MDPKHLFPALPEDLTAVTPEDLGTLLEEFKVAARGIKGGTTDFADLSPEDVVEQYRAGAVAIRAIEDELKAREEGVEVFAATLAEIDEGIDLGETDGDDGDDGEDGSVTELAVEGEALKVGDTDEDGNEVVEIIEEEEAVVASSEPRRLALPAVPKQHRALVSEMEDASVSFVAAAGLPNVKGGTRLDRRQLAETFIAARSQRTALPEGFEDNMVVATMDYSHLFGDDRRLDDDIERNMGKLDTLYVENQVASGGLCAPPTNVYDIVSYGSDARPVRDALVAFNAVRGGVNVPTGLSIANIDDGVGIVTAAQDALGGPTNAAKSCLAITCPTYTATHIDAVYACIEFGNLNSRAWPELIERFLVELAAQHARVAETNLLDGIDATSTAVTRALQYSGTSTILAGMLQAVSAYRLRVRSAPEMRFRMLLPDWLPELLLNDLWNQQFGRWDIQTEAQITAKFAQVGVDVSYYLDTPTSALAGMSTFDDVQAAGVLHPFPDAVVGYLFPEGTYLFLDMGTLDLGIVRDSTLNATNDYQIFSETFENVAFVGVQSLKITYTVTHSGELAPAGTYVA